MKKWARWGAIALSFCWLAFVYASFYLVQQQRPLSQANMVALGSTLLDLVVAGGMLFVAAMAGGQVCRWLGLRFEHSSEVLIWGTGIGLGVLGLAMLGLGLAGWLSREAALGLLAAAALLSVRSFVPTWRAVMDLRSIVRPGRGLAVYLAVMLALTLLVALTPPTSWDGLFYHLTFPRLWIEQGRITPVTDVPHQYFPGLVEMLYLLAMLIKGDVAAKLLHFAYLGLLGGGVYLIAQRTLGPTYGWPAVTALAATPMVFVLGGWAYNDLALAFYQIAALYALLRWLRAGQLRWLVLSAIVCGLAMGIKYTSFVCPVMMVLFVCWRFIRDRGSWKMWARALAVFCGVTLTIAASWYARNLAFTGNPVYPFAYSLFGGRAWDAWRAAWYARAGTGLGLEIDKLLALPWTLTIGIRDMNFYDGRVGPLYLVALPFVIGWALRLFGRTEKHPQAAGYLLAFAGAQYAMWMVGVMQSRSLFQSRLLLPGLAALCPVMGYVFDALRGLDTRLLSLRRLVGMTVALVLVANTCYQFLAVVAARPLPVIVGQESRAAFLTRRLGAYYAAMETVNENVPSDGRVLFLWEPRSYYCQRPVQPDPILERWAWLLHRHEGDIASIARDLEGDGYTHVLLFRAGLERVRRIGLDPIGVTQVSALDAFVDGYCDRVIRVGDAYELYRLSVDNQGV